MESCLTSFQFSCSICVPWKNRYLIASLGIRDVAQRFRSSKLGMFWAVIQPLAVVVMYYFVFAVVFNNRWGRPDEPRGEFVLALFAGFLVYNLFADIVSRSPTLVTGNPNYVKKLVFPLEILPFVPAVAALISAAINFAILLAVFVLVRRDTPFWADVLLPFLLLPVLLLALGFSWFLSTICTYFKDVAHAVPLVLQALVFLSPVLYSMDRVPNGMIRETMSMNPLRIPIELVRALLLDGRLPDWTSYGCSMLAALAVYFLGYTFFRRTRLGFADVL